MKHYAATEMPRPANHVFHTYGNMLAWYGPQQKHIITFFIQVIKKTAKIVRARLEARLRG